MGKIVKSMSFNPSLSDEEEMLEHIKNIRFAPYIKRLIWNDMRGRNIIPQSVNPTNILTRDDTSYMDDLF